MRSPRRQQAAARTRVEVDATLRWLVLAGACSCAHANVDLTTLSMEQLMDLRVVGASKYEQKQSEVAAAVSILTRADIQAFGWRTIDQALTSLPGVYSTYDRQYVYLGARGFGLPGDYNTRLLVTINGNRTNDVVYDAGPMGRQVPLDIDLVERIEFIPGPGGAVYGQNAMFGVVNVVTRTGGGVDGAEMAARFQQPQGQREGRASWGKTLAGGLDLLASVSGLRARGEDRFFDYGGAGISGVARGLDGDRDEELFLRAAQGAWSFDLVWGDHRKDDPTGSYLSDPLVSGQYQGDRYTLAQLQYRDRFLDGTLDLQGRLFAGRERYYSRLSYGTLFEFPANSRWRGVELRMLYTGLASHKLMFGLEAQQSSGVEQEILDLATPANNVAIRGSGSRTGVYVQDEWRIADALAATFGLRLDNGGAVTRLSPRLAAIWQASAASVLKVLYGRAHREPNAYERDYDDGFAQIANPGLRGESIDTLELVADHRIGSDLNLRAAAYRWTMHDLIVLGVDPSSGIAQYRSGGAVQARGVELSADKTWSWGGRLRGSLSLQHARNEDGSRLLNSPDRLAKLHFSSPLPVAGLRLGGELLYDSPRLALAGNRTGGYTLANVHLGIDRLTPGLSVGLGVLNLFDKHYVHPGADTNWQNTLEQDGRSVQVEAVLKF